MEHSPWSEPPSKIPATTIYYLSIRRLGNGINLGFISIMRYREIDRGVGDLAIIAAPRHQTISPMKASLTSALLNSSHRTHSVIIIARTVTGHHLKSPDRRPVGDRAPQRDRAVQHTQHYIRRHCMICTLPTHIFPIQADHDDEWTTAGAGGGLFVASTPCHPTPATVCVGRDRCVGRVPLTEVCRL